MHFAKVRAFRMTQNKYRLFPKQYVPTRSVLCEVRTEVLHKRLLCDIAAQLAQACTV